MSSSQKKVQIKRTRRRRRVCFCCANKIDVLDYKETDIVKRFVTDRGKIVPKRNSGSCAKHQRLIASTVKRARFMGLIPFTID
jgi:small subunit ribosomal protein S18